MHDLTPQPDAPAPATGDAIAAAAAPAPSRSELPAGLRRYRMTLAYDGTLFHGWQRQEPAGLEPLRTVQGVVNSALLLLLRQPVNLVGASRTDAGVHAQGQVAHFDAATRIAVERLPHAINSRLPEDIDVISVAPAADDFQAIGGAINKQYRYRIFNSGRRPLCKRTCVWHCWAPLDVQRMKAAAARFVGTHDFAAFTAAGHDRVTTVRTIFRCDIEVDEPEVHIVLEGDGFLYNMVRIIAGTIVEVGRGRFAPEQVDVAIACGDRRQAGPTLPPQGLVLEWIRYAGD